MRPVLTLFGSLSFIEALIDVQNDKVFEVYIMVIDITFCFSLAFPKCIGEPFPFLTSFKTKPQNPHKTPIHISKDTCNLWDRFQEALCEEPNWRLCVSQPKGEGVS